MNDENGGKHKYSAEQILDIFMDEISDRLNGNRFFYFSVKNDEMADGIVTNMPPKIVVTSFVNKLADFVRLYPTLKEDIHGICDKLHLLNQEIIEIEDDIN